MIAQVHRNLVPLLRLKMPSFAKVMCQDASRDTGLTESWQLTDPYVHHTEIC